MVQHEQEAETNGWIAHKLARSGIKDIQLMPRLHQKEAVLRKKIYGKEYIKQFGDKNADAFIGRSAVEFKEANTRNLVRRIREASKQANVVVVKSKDLLTKEYMDRFVNGQWNLEDRANITRIFIINDGEVYLWNRPQ